ncbi:hypothetical protein [Streptomyces sp. NPDC101234]|uniref:hypothetical protein n=1 Tax=Streptomyces sp. NPDC101234 TaxID=3366138 RepID=UPI0037FDA94C
MKLRKERETPPDSAARAWPDDVVREDLAGAADDAGDGDPGDVAGSDLAAST